jgi:potassium channel subfamily T protein 1
MILQLILLRLIIGRPPNLLYLGSNPTLCKLLKTPSSLCCLELNRECEHKSCIQASDYKWKNRCILIVAEFATNGLFNFILPLRAQVRSTMFLKPIVLLLENPPNLEFLEAISCFPLIYWIQGTINNINTILKAGIMDSDTVIVVSPEKYAHIDDDSLTDCSNIVSVQNLYR